LVFFNVSQFFLKNIPGSTGILPSALIRQICFSMRAITLNREAKICFGAGSVDFNKAYRYNKTRIHCQQDGMKLMAEENWIVVCRAAGMVNARIILGRLETDDIPARLQYEAIGVISYSLDVDGLGEVRIFVPESYAARAREVLAQRFTENDLRWEEN